MSEVVYQIIKEILTDDESKLVPTARLIDDLGADSLTAVEIVMEVEKKLDITIDDSEVDNIVTIQDVINIVEAKQ
tara:strand:+ start:184 stop:408 length:225 start_codon:yes stop_codon:yes gene_type:complete